MGEMRAIPGQKTVMTQTIAIRQYREKTASDTEPPATCGDLFEVDPLRDERWQRLVEEHPASSVFHRAEWLSALRSAYGYEPVVYTRCEPSAELTSGIVFCKVKSWVTGRRLVSLPFSDHCDPLLGTGAEFGGILAPLLQSVSAGKWEYCEVRPAHFDPDPSTGMGESNRYLWHLIDLRPGIEVIFRNLHHSMRRKVRRAEREQLTYEEGNTPRLLQQFYKLVVATRRRQRLPPQPLRWFRSLVESMGDALKIRLVSKDGVPVAGILTLDHKRTVTYKYGCSEAALHPLGGMAMLFWKTMQQAKAAGYDGLDLGRSDIGNEGLITFKHHLGGVAARLGYWRYPNHPDYNHSPVTRRVVERFVSVAPDWVLSAVGNLCYRHIG